MDSLFSVKIYHDDKTLELNKNGIEVVNLTGFDPAGATISKTKKIGKNGAKIDNKYIESRTIGIELEIKENVQENILQLYDFFIPTENIIIEYSNSIRHVYAYGTVEDTDIDRFSKNIPSLINVVCGDPYLYHYEKYNDILQNGRSIIVNNNGDVECGMIIRVTCLQDTGIIKIVNQTNRQYFCFTYPLEASDIIEINSNINSHKTIYLYRNDEKINIFNSIENGSSWIMLNKGENMIVAETSIHKIEFIHEDLFLGA